MPPKSTKKPAPKVTAVRKRARTPEEQDEPNEQVALLRQVVELLQHKTTPQKEHPNQPLKDALDETDDDEETDMDDTSEVLTIEERCVDDPAEFAQIKLMCCFDKRTHVH